MMPEEIDLSSLFNMFCDHFDGKLLWRQRGKQWTKQILDFFSAEAARRSFLAKREYMSLDLVWFSNHSDIVLAFEHELQQRAIGKIVDSELRHLIDIKAVRKVGVFYVSEPDEKSLIESGVVAWLKGHRLKVAYPSEQYMIIIGRPATKLGERVLLFREYRFYANGLPLGQPTDRTLRQSTSKSMKAA
jgi:hypothetical protein